MYKITLCVQHVKRLAHFIEKEKENDKLLEYLDGHGFALPAPLHIYLVHEISIINSFQYLSIEILSKKIQFSSSMKLNRNEKIKESNASQ